MLQTDDINFERDIGCPVCGTATTAPCWIVDGVSIAPEMAQCRPFLQAAAAAKATAAAARAASAEPIRQGAGSGRALFLSAPLRDRLLAFAGFTRKSRNAKPRAPFLRSVRVTYRGACQSE